MLLAFSIIGIILSVLLIYFNAKHFSSSIYLGLFFFLISLYGFIQYAVLYSNSVYLVAILFLNTGFLTYLTGPALYWYVRSVLTDNFRFRKNDFLHLIPAIIFLVCVIQYILTPWSYKVEIASRIVADPDFMGSFKDVLLYKLFSFGQVFLSHPVLIILYTFWSLAIIIKFILAKKENSVLSQQKFMIKWLVVLIGFLLILAISQSFELIRTITIKDSSSFYTFNILQVLSLTGLAGLLISPFFFPGILYGLPRLPDVTNEMSTPEASSVPQKRIVNRFEYDYLVKIGEKTDSCMAEYQPYLQHDFNLARLSVLIDTPSHHLSYFFREYKKESFVDYRNEWRVNHAKNLIIEGKTTGLTLEAIGLLSGFSSRNTFLNAFKKTEGITPNDFVSRTKQ